MDSFEKRSTFLYWPSHSKQYSLTPKINRTQQYSTSVHFYKGLSKHFYKSQHLSPQRSLEKLIFHTQNTKPSQKLHFQDHDPLIIDHDIQLQRYLSGQKSFQNHHNQPITHFYQQMERQNNFNQIAPENYFPNQKQTHYIGEHKKQKSKSQTSFRIYVNQHRKFRKSNILEHKKHETPQRKQNPEWLQKPIEQISHNKRSKPLRYLDVKSSSQNNFQPLDIREILKKVNEKKETDLKDMLKRMNQPKCNTIGGLNLQRFYEHSNREKGNLRALQKKCKRTQQQKDKQQQSIQQSTQQKLSSQQLKQLHHQYQQTKMTAMRKLQRELVMRKMRQNRRLRKQETTNEILLTACNNKQKMNQTSASFLY